MQIMAMIMMIRKKNEPINPTSQYKMNQQPQPQQTEDATATTSFSACDGDGCW